MTPRRNTTARPAGNARRELRASDGFGPIEFPAAPLAHEPVRIPCLAGRWFSPRCSATPRLTALTPKLLND